MGDVLPLKEIFLQARKCQRCYPGEGIHVPLPDPANSDGKAEIVFINERPGRIGTGDSGYVSFDNDDPSANFFKECFEAAELDRKQVFITNACLCHPLIDGYTDTAPKVKEMKNCHYWLEQQLHATNPLLIVTIGRVAYESVMRYFLNRPPPKHPTFLDTVGSVIRSTTPWIYPLAHTSKRGRINRKADLQKQDWLAIPRLLSEAKRANIRR